MTASSLHTALQELLEMVPKPVKAVLMCFPITEEIEKAAKAGVCRHKHVFLAASNTQPLALMISCMHAPLCRG
jgi:hypothetical protein